MAVPEGERALVSVLNKRVSAGRPCQRLRQFKHVSQFSIYGSQVIAS